jgi:hypothetical protein
MNITRMYTGDDSQTHFEELDVPLREGPYGSISKLVPLKGVAFRTTPLGLSMDFHNAPARQFVITLVGRVEIEVGSGEKREFGAGDILLADDVTGQGHITRELEGPRRSLFLPLPDDFDISVWRA